MKKFEESIRNIRKSRRKFQTEMTCRFDDNLTEFPIWDISNNGFSFLCNNDSFFKEGAIFNKISIFNNEKLEVINGTGTIVSVSEFDKNKARIGIQFDKKRMDRMVGGKIRIQRHFPKIRIDTSLTLKNKKGSFVIAGTILDYTASTARIEFSDEISDHKFQIGDEFEILISINDRVLLNGMVFVLRIKDDNSEVIINFIDQHLDISAIETISKSFQNKNSIITTLESIKKFDKISDEYKALICDWRLYLSSLKNILDYEEKFHNLKIGTEMELFLQSIEEEVLNDQNNFIARLNKIADKVPDSENLEYKKYFRKNLIQFIKTSPLAASIIDRDNGYPGDFETIKQFFVNPYSGDSLFGKLMNKFIYSTDAVQAHQRRIQYLYDQLCSMYEKSEKEFSFLLFGSGPAEEVLRFVERNDFPRPVYATLVDMDAFALADFSERLQFVQKENFFVELVNLNILDLIRNKNMNLSRDKYSLTYSAGLFDYFKDTFCKRFIRSFVDYTEEGGSIIITNVHKNNSTRYLMDYGGGWDVIHRDDKEMLKLVPPDIPVELSFDENQANIFLKLVIPEKSK